MSPGIIADCVPHTLTILFVAFVTCGMTWLCSKRADFLRQTPECFDRTFCSQTYLHFHVCPDMNVDKILCGI